MSSFSPQNLLQTLRRYPNVSNYWLGFSGGLDSTVLLHALVQIRETLNPIKIHVLHVDHGLQKTSSQWAEHCAALCQQYQLDCQVLDANLGAIEKGCSVEEVAREARYRLMADYIGPDDALLTAQHQDDQAETFLIQALRGAGPKGLASMPEIKPYSKGKHIRPLLAYSRKDLERYAVENSLSWVDDPSNSSSEFKRNYLRQEVVPLIRQEWPGYADAVSRSAKHCAESSSLLDNLAEIDLEQALAENGNLSRSACNALAVPRRANLIRYWLVSQGLRLPDQRRMTTLIDQLEQSADDRQLCVDWPGVEVRSYRDQIFAAPPLASFAENQAYLWSLAQVLPISDGELSATKDQTTGGVPLSVDIAEVEVRFRTGGERCQPIGQAHTRELKTLFQEWGVPPWWRDRIPLIYVDDKLAAVVGFCSCQPFAPMESTGSWHIHWSTPDILPFKLLAN